MVPLNRPQPFTSGMRVFDGLIWTHEGFLATPLVSYWLGGSTRSTIFLTGG